MAGEQQESVYIFCQFGQSGDKIVPVDVVEAYRFFSLPRSITRCIMERYLVEPQYIEGYSEGRGTA